MKLIDRVQLRWLKLALKKHDGNKTHACKWLGISIRTFRNWEINYGLRPMNEPYQRYTPQEKLKEGNVNEP